MTVIEKYNKIKKVIPKEIFTITDKIDEKLKKKIDPIWYIGLTNSLESELKCQVRSTNIDAEVAQIIANRYGIWDIHYENMEPTHVRLKRERVGSILGRV